MTEYDLNPPVRDDQEWRAKEDEWMEHLQAVAEREAERLYEARPHPKPAVRVKRRDVDHSVGRHWRDTVLERDQGCIFHTNPAYCSTATLWRRSLAPVLSCPGRARNEGSVDGAGFGCKGSGAVFT